MVLYYEYFLTILLYTKQLQWATEVKTVFDLVRYEKSTLSLKSENFPLNRPRITHVKRL